MTQSTPGAHADLDLELQEFAWRHGFDGVESMKTALIAMQSVAMPSDAFVQGEARSVASRLGKRAFGGDAGLQRTTLELLYGMPEHLACHFDPATQQAREHVRRVYRSTLLDEMARQGILMGGKPRR